MGSSSVLSSCDECVICLNPMQSICVLKCNHQYHRQCIMEWAKTSSECPVCRSKIKYVKPIYKYSPKKYKPIEYKSDYTYTPTEYNTLYSYIPPEYEVLFNNT